MEAKSRWHTCRELGAVDAALDEHLAGCDDCRGYAHEQALLAELLGELRADTQVLTSTGAGERRRSLGRWRKAGRVSGMAAAIVLLAAGGFFLSDAVRDSGSTSGDVGPTDRVGVVMAVPAVPAKARLGVTLRNESAEQMLAVARSSSQANVQVYWLYPAMKTGQVDDESGTDGLEPM